MDDARRLLVLSRFARFVLSEVFDGELDGAELQEVAEREGLIRKTTYDPVLHGHSDYAQPGDDWYELTEVFRDGE